MVLLILSIFFSVNLYNEIEHFFLYLVALETKMYKTRKRFCMKMEFGF